MDDYQLGNPTKVYHMEARVSVGDWHDSVYGSRIDLAGVVLDMDRATRTEIVDKALGYYGKSPQPLDVSCYWMGEGSPDCHERFPNDDEAYGFSCASLIVAYGSLSSIQM